MQGLVLQTNITETPVITVTENASNEETQGFDGLTTPEQAEKMSLTENTSVEEKQGFGGFQLALQLPDLLIRLIDPR